MPYSCDTMDWSPSGSAVHGILQARILEWGVISLSRGTARPRNWTQISRIAGRCFTNWATRKVISMRIRTGLSFVHSISSREQFLAHSKLQKCCGRSPWLPKMPLSETALTLHFFILINLPNYPSGRTMIPIWWMRKLSQSLNPCIHTERGRGAGRGCL